MELFQNDLPLPSFVVRDWVRGHGERIPQSTADVLRIPNVAPGEYRACIAANCEVGVLTAGAILDLVDHQVRRLASMKRAGEHSWHPRHREPVQRCALDEPEKTVDGLDTSGLFVADLSKGFFNVRLELNPPGLSSHGILRRWSWPSPLPRRKGGAHHPRTPCCRESLLSDRQPASLRIDATCR